MLSKGGYILLAALLVVPGAAAMVRPPQKEKARDKVQLINAKSAHLIEKNGQSFRKVVGPARFRHNDTDLLCDSALWNVSTNIIDATGHVRIIQSRTKLSSSTLQYVVDENMAKFRGDLVQLEDSDGSLLRTRYLDYNTKDSVAIFQDGAAMRDKDGQLMESMYGTYDAKAKLFVFNDRVNMYMDTTFVKTSRLEYRSDLSTAYFGFGTDMWQGKDMLSANDGWYDRSRELFFFRKKVHLLTENQETWSDSLYYHRDIGDVEMLGNVEIMDTTRNVYALAGRFEYTDSLSQVRMTRDPAVMSVTDDKGRIDTVYVGADILVSRGIRRCDIPKETEQVAQQRLKDISGDPVMEYRKKAAEEAAKQAEEAAKNDPQKAAEDAARKVREGRAQNPDDAPPVKGGGKPKMPKMPEERQVQDSVAVQAPADTTALSAPADTLPPAPDTSKVNFLWGSKNVKLFRRDMQMASDSITYTDLDSLVRLYKDPIFFSDGDRQYASDSIYMVIKDKRMQKAHLLSNAFITIEEAPGAYDQIRGAEMVAYFDSTSALTRFDALGSASSLFYLEENNALATVNKVDSKMIYATFKDNALERIYYYDNPKNDGYPTVQLPEEEKSLKGFRWEPEKRPKSPLDITPLVPRNSERTSYLARPHATFTQTEIYFPGYIGNVYKTIAERDSLRVVREREAAAAKAAEASKVPEAGKEPEAVKEVEEVKEAPADTVSVPVEKPVVERVDTTVSRPVLPPPAAPADTASAKPETKPRPAPSDSVSKPVIVPVVVQEPSAKELKRRERERLKAIKEAERKARWEELDRRDSIKREEKAQKKLEAERAKKLKILRKREQRAQKERAKFEKYLQKEREKAARKQERELLKAQRKKKLKEKL